MIKLRTTHPCRAAMLAGCLALAACQSRTNLSATGNAPAQYSHVYLTVTQVWFNASATAGPTDSGWSQYTLSSPVTLDLVALADGALSQLASNLKVSPGSYGQMRLILADPSATLTASAQSGGALSNDEVDYTDSAGTLHQVPLGIPNSAEGIGISTNLTVSGGGASGLGALSSSPGDSSTTSGLGIGTSSTSGSSPTSVVATTSAIIDFDATRDLVPVSLSGQEGFLLIPHPTVYSGTVGTIAGSVNLSGIAVTATTGVPDVQVAAEGVSGDGSRHTIVKTTLVSASGSFTLYPLDTASNTPSTYDLVIHGPAIDTVIVKSVPVASGAPGAAVVQLGTIPLTSAGAMAVNLSTSAPVSPSASSVGFYQTLPLSGEIPYLIELRNADPGSGVFAADQSLSAGSLEYATYSSAGSTLALTATAPTEGAATYHVAAFNSPYGQGPMTTTVASAGSSTATFTAGAIPLPSGASAATVGGTISVASPGTYDKGELLFTQNGVVVAAAPLDAFLSVAQSTGTLATGIPGGSGTTLGATYYAEAWVWNSSDPLGTLSRQPYTGSIDLSSGNGTGIALAIQ